MSVVETPNPSETVDSPLLKQVIAHFDDHQVPYTRLGETNLLEIPCSGESGRWRCCCHVDEDWDKCHFYSIAPVQIPEEQRLAMAEFITRINYGMAIGNFELDFADGELRFKTSTELLDDASFSERLKSTLQINLQVLDDLLSLIFAVGYKQLSPQAAVEILQNGSVEARSAA